MPEGWTGGGGRMGKRERGAEEDVEERGGKSGCRVEGLAREGRERR